jgi:hypothetical protein
MKQPKNLSHLLLQESKGSDGVLVVFLYINQIKNTKISIKRLAG